MIINREHDFGFVHIPKCAGSSIRQQLRAFDDAQGRFYRTLHLEGIGAVNGNHVPLSLLASHFPEDLRALREVTSYTITREPMDRFVSAVAQFLRAKNVEPAELEPGALRQETYDIMDYLRSLTGFPHVFYAVFLPQADYVFLNGEKVVDHVHAMERIDLLFDALERRHGFELKRESVWNPTVTYRFPALTDGLKRAKDTARRILPLNAYMRLRDAGLALLTTRGVPHLTEMLRNDARVQAFVASHYARDRELHAEALLPRETRAERLEKTITD